MTYTPGLLVHIIGGIAGVFSGSTALVARKGSALHRAAGNVFVVSMMSMAAGGAYLAILKSQHVNTLMGILTIYLVASAWVTVRRREGQIGLMELALLAMVLSDAATGFLFGMEAVNHPRHGNPPGAYWIFLIIAGLFAVAINKS